MDLINIFCNDDIHEYKISLSDQHLLKTFILNFIIIPEICILSIKCA